MSKLFQPGVLGVDLALGIRCMSRRERWLPVLTFFAAVLSLSQGPVVFAGGVSDGGGNLCYLNGTPVLLEFADLHSQLQEKGIQIYESKMSELYGFSSFQSLYKRDRLKQRIDAILAANEASSPIFVSWLKAILDGLQFSVTSIPIEAPVAADATDQPLCRNGNVRASVLFFPPVMGFVDRAQFNSLDLDSQAGLLIHEAGRFIQYTANGTLGGGPSRDKFTDLDLQRSTRILFDVYRQGNSDGVQSLDRENLFDAIADQVLITPETDLCLTKFTFEEAKKNLSSKKKRPRRGSKVAREESGPGLSEIWDEQRRIEASLPAVFREICEGTYDSSPWIALQERIEIWQREVEKTLSSPENQRGKLEMLSVLRKTREAPPGHRSRYPDAHPHYPSFLPTEVSGNRSYSVGGQPLQHSRDRSGWKRADRIPGSTGHPRPLLFHRKCNRSISLIARWHLNA